MHPISIQDTVSVASINMILAGASRKGADPDALIQAIGANHAQLSHPDGRVSLRQIQLLWREAVAATGEPDLALQLGELVNPMALGVLAYVMLHSPTLGAACIQLVRYQEIACEGIQTGIQALPNGLVALTLTITSPDVIYPLHALNSELSLYQAAFGVLTGQPFTTRRVCFSYPRPANTSPYEHVFGVATLEFDAPITSLVFDAGLLDTPILNANPSLFSIFETHANALLEQVRPTQQTTSKAVKREIVTLLKGAEPTLAAVADRLALGQRTLQLHLRAEGTTFQHLLDEVRCDLAERHLRQHHVSLTDIAYLLGYAELSVFVRSFKKWTGQTPGAFREQLMPLAT